MLHFFGLLFHRASGEKIRIGANVIFSSLAKYSSLHLVCVLHRGKE